MNLQPYIPSFKNLKTPFYFYDIEFLRNHLLKVKNASDKYGYHIHYALKANANNKILHIFNELGFGADCVSGNEVKKALEIGISPNKIAFAGVGKTDQEIELALKNNIFSFNCESIPELLVIQEIAERLNVKAPVSLRINPNVDANTHKYITTGLEENKFGINRWEFEDVIEVLKNAPNLKLQGLHFHIGSQITDMQVFKNLCSRVNEIQQWFYSKNFQLPHLNLGGGLGVDYENPSNINFPDFEVFFGIFNTHLDKIPAQQIHFELGRSLIAQAGVLISRVLYVKKGINTNFAIIDAGMTELIRPALYQAFHKILPLHNYSTNSYERYDIVGPICESSDTFAKSILLPKLTRGDLIAIYTVGAYGEVMASRYNLRDLPKAYYSDEFK
jgi:diaminopimelate decarboxylase